MYCCGWRNSCLKKCTKQSALSTYYIIYHSLILTALVLSAIAYRQGNSKFIYLTILLFVTLVVELLAEGLSKKDKPFVWSYHIFVVVEYALLCCYCLSALATENYRHTIRISVPVFIIFSLCVSYFWYQFQSFPGINISTEGFLLFILFTYLLFNLDIDMYKPVYHHPDFWIAIGVLIFFGGTFFFNGIYTRLLNLDAEKAKQLFGIINKPLNLLLYSCMIIGLLCSIQKRSYITP